MIGTMAIFGRFWAKIVSLPTAPVLVVPLRQLLYAFKTNANDINIVEANAQHVEASILV